MKVKQVNFKATFIFLCCSFQLMAQNVGIGTTTPAAKLNVVGSSSDPSIPGPTSTGIFRIGVSSEEGIDFGKLSLFPYSAWMQSGYSGNAPTPISLQPLGGNVGIGITSPHESAALDVTSTTQGLLPPRMTKVQRDAIATPAEGLMISCTDCSVKGLHQYINGAWQAVTSSNTGNYGTVTNPITGKTWLDRNLGATRVALSSTDAASYGDLYQWGRNADGHQIRTSGTSTTLSSNYFTTIGLFITTSTSPFNWLSAVETHMWSGTAAENNPCPSGFRIPTAAEWEQERRTWTSNNAAGAFTSPLKLPMAGGRDDSDGSLVSVGSDGVYWSSTVSGANSRHLLFNSGIAYMGTFYRASGYSVRCIKD